jgi:diaminopimelate epimerase
MKLPFFKYQGTGNDFILVNQTQQTYIDPNNKALIQHLCDRRFGIGADGLMLLTPPENANTAFKMVYFNADGSESSMCGNGGRCIAAFAQKLGVASENCVFDAIDGQHEARINPEKQTVELKMSDVQKTEIGTDYVLLNTGSPHFVVMVEDLTDINVYEAGREIRYSNRFRAEGVNVNFVEKKEKGKILEVATYERGVEAETFSCGTGVTAAAIAFFLKELQYQNPETNARTFNIPIQSKGGNLEVRFTAHKKNSDFTFNHIWLSGAATLVFEGQIEI